MRSAGVPEFPLAQLLTYFEEYKRNAFGVGAPTNAVLEVGGQEPEEFETIAQRYLAAASKRTPDLGGLSRVMLMLTKAMLTPGLTLEAFERRNDLPHIQNARFTTDSPDWQETHVEQELQYR